jgi:phage baseplate assembly protein W
MSNAFPAVTGYPASLWTCIRSTMVYASVTLDTLTGQAASSLAMTVADSMRNARDSLDAFQLAAAAGQGYANISLVLAFPLAITARQLALVTARIQALQAFALQVPLLLPTPGVPSTLLPNGKPSIADPGFLEYLMAFTAEALPSGTTAANLPATAQEEADAWVALANVAAPQVSGATLNEINYMASVAQTVATAILHVTISSAADLLTTWNTLVSIPAIMSYSDAGANDPTSAAAQQISVIRLLLGENLAAFNLLDVVLRQQPPQQVQLATVRQNDSLMAMAARELGNFELWYSIAQINNLVPPFIASVRMQGVAIPGDQLYMPTGPVPSGTPQTPPQYEQAFLGVDIYYGPINQDMLPWTGDLQTIAGYNNLAFSLGRRLQTPLGSLIYHLNFGSRIPAAIGGVTTSGFVGTLKAYATSAVLTDARVAQVVSVTATVLANYAINLQATALPKGIGQFSVQVVQSFTPAQVPG